MKATTCDIITAALRAEGLTKSAIRQALDLLEARECADKAAHLGALLTDQAGAARMLRVSRHTIHRMVRDGQLIPILVRGLRRYRVADLHAIADRSDR